MADATTRLIKCLRSEAESQILGSGLVREVLYRALCGDQALVLYSLAMHSCTFSQVARALKVVQSFSSKAKLTMLKLPITIKKLC